MNMLTDREGCKDFKINDVDQTWIYHGHIGYIIKDTVIRYSLTKIQCFKDTTIHWIQCT